MMWNDVFDPELEPQEVLLNKVPALHGERRERFRKFVGTDLIFCIAFEDTGQRYTLRLGPDQADGQPGEMIDFPQATVRGQAANWRRSMELASQLAKPADEHMDRYVGQFEIDDAIIAGFERFDGVLDVEIIDLPDGQPPLSFEIILNDYSEPSRAPRASLTVDWSVLVELANGAITPVEAGRQVTIRGAMGLALDLGGFFVTEFDL